MSEEEKRIPKTFPKEIPNYYINSVSITSSIYDFMFTFGLKSEPSLDPEPIAIIRMSPHHAKVFSKVFSKNVKSYEEKVGEIILPEDLRKELEV